MPRFEIKKDTDRYGDLLSFSAVPGRIIYEGTAEEAEELAAMLFWGCGEAGCNDCFYAEPIGEPE